MQISKKILVISPTPSHPQNAGNRARIFSLLLNLRELGHDVYFVHIQETPGDEESMQQCWQEKYDAIPYKRPKSGYKIPAKRIDRKIIRKVQSILWGSDANYTYLLDHWYDHSVNKFLQQLAQKINPDVVIVEYVFFSQALNCFSQNVLKIIDTHDIFADRYKIYLKNNQSPQWYSTTLTEEIKGLNRADVILAIQRKEAEFLAQKLPDKKIVSVGHLVPLYQNTKKKLEYNILFVGSSNPINVQGIDYFIQAIFPQVRAKFFETKLILAGEICDVVEDFDRSFKLGRVDNLKDAYDRADIVISPILFGTGLKIKNIEALGYSKPLVTTSVGAEGMEHGAGTAFLVADSPEEFAAAIAKIFSDVELYQNLSHNAYNFAQAWNKTCLRVLTDILNLKS